MNLLKLIVVPCEFLFKWYFLESLTCGFRIEMCRSVALLLKKQLKLVDSEWST